jgi:hypothetical protein
VRSSRISRNALGLQVALVVPSPSIAPGRRALTALRIAEPLGLGVQCPENHQATDVAALAPREYLKAAESWKRGFVFGISQLYDRRGTT